MVQHTSHSTILLRSNSISHSLTHSVGTEVIPVNLLQILKSHVLGYDPTGSVAEERAGGGIGGLLRLLQSHFQF